MNAIACEIIDPASPNSVSGFFVGRSRRISYLGHLDVFQVDGVKIVYQLVNAKTREIIDPASPNSVYGLFMGRSRMGSYLGHLDVLSKSLRSTQSIGS